ncbi:hypothetical protein TpMuguga_01g00909 [Theileria parva strain Muguga]|uniref:C2H2-type domain-containing protein n=1 Tax=Theileria parva TaxID=5875 RepID=Q4N7B1_THEPA|nr:uncharacterized protein TpMuguga_01g00909 [Theileria parva strain Muguga]EAN34147.1 hypothetical protein TpMuguga_01g00909 [Theileria parva strain Muguga]|eukprot:XP_766430.1 hypothetical protein [Theileria parva strain Muguga]
MLEYRPENFTSEEFRLTGSLFCSCGVPFTNRHRNVPCYHVFCQNCINNVESQNKCKMCDSIVEKVEELHPNEDIFVCTVQRCNQAFLNFPSLKAHAKLSHSVSVDTVDDFYEKFGDVEYSIPKTQLLTKDKHGFKTVSTQNLESSQSPMKFGNQDSSTGKSEKSPKKNTKSNLKEDDFESLM